VGEALVRLGYSEPCELRIVPQARTLATLHRSSAWRRHAHLVVAGEPSDVWRELCWRYVTYPAVAGGRPAHLVFAVYLRQHRPAVQAALVDSSNGAVLPWPPGPARPAETPVPRPRLGAEEPARNGTGTDPGLGIPAFPGSRFSDLPFSREI
jgi:hypothetical protein